MNYDLKFIDFNHAYFVLCLDSESLVLKLIDHLLKNDIVVRRYFYPSLNTLNYITNDDSCPISEEISKRVICLPLYHELTNENQEFIVSKIKEIC